jgi:plastocyanin
VLVRRIRFGRKSASLFGAGAILAFAAACGGSTGVASPTPGGTTTPGGTGTSAVAACSGSGGTAVEAVDTLAFTPAGVTIAVGQTVTWTNTGSAAHTVSFTGGPDCGRIDAGQSVSRTFTTTGFFGYLCSFHATMAGSVTVE